MRLNIIGAGGWGTALATILSANGLEPTLWVRERETADTINNTHENSAFLPGVTLSKSIRVVNDLAAAAGYFKQAADRGDSYGKLKFGLMQQSGKGIVRNVEQAVNSLVAAFEMRDVDLEVILRDTPEQLSTDARLAIKQVLAERKLIAGAENAEIDPITLGAIEKHYATK